jgi:hypothetical protein
MHRSWRTAGFHMDNHSRQPGDCYRSLQLDFSGLSHMATRVRVTFFVLAFVAFQPNSFGGDNKTATDYADDAVASMELEYNALAALVREGKVSAAELEGRADELFHAQLLQLQLRKDDAGITVILRKRMETRDEELDRLHKVGDRVGAQQIQVAQLKSLQARLHYAKHTGDQQLAEATLSDALTIEEAKLQFIISAAERGFESQSAIAKQKLRLATMIAHRDISLP